MKKLLVLMLLWPGAAVPCFAQGAMSSFAASEPTPVVSQLFRLNQQQYNHHFEFALPNDGTLKIDFLRLSDWGEKNQLAAMAEAAAQQVKMLKDSFNNNYSTKLLEMNIPIDGKIIALNYQEDTKGKRQLAYKEGIYYQLKTGFDTIRIIKNVGIRTKPLADSGLIQVQYTFILKDLNDIISLADEPDAINKTGIAADETINKFRSRWNQQDARSHQLSLTYDVKNETVKRSESDNKSGLFRYIDIYVGIGAMFYTNNLVSPYFEESIAFLIPSRSRLQPFAGVNISGFGFLSSNGNKDNASYTTYNLEIGYCKRASAFMSQKTSMMLGLMKVSNPDNTKSSLFHMGFTLGFNSFLSGGFNIGTDFKNKNSKSLLGVNFKFNL